MQVDQSQNEINRKIGWTAAAILIKNAAVFADSGSGAMLSKISKISLPNNRKNYGISLSIDTWGSAPYKGVTPYRVEKS